MKRIVLLVLAVCASFMLMAQELSGIITKGGKPKKGLTVTLLNGGVKTTSDKYGRFYFQDAKPGDVLQVKITSRKVAEIPVSGARLVKIHMASDDFSVNSGSQERRLPYTVLSLPRINGNVVGREQIELSGLLRLSDILKQFLLIKLIPGSIFQTYYDSDILVRGVNSVGSGNSPLFFIDGVEYEGTDIDSLVPVEAIQRIEIHKDAAQWGARGANGVILITTTRS